MARATTAESNRAETKVFVSYSRRDSEFVRLIVSALELHKGLKIFRDTEDILPSEEWKKRLGSLIESADTIVFCLSPDSTASKVCSWEAEYAESLNKRIVPIVLRDVASAPTPLAKLNYIFFNQPDRLEDALADLVAALEMDIDWIREHTRLGALSQRWQKSGSRADQLLRSSELDLAETWLTSRPTKAPDPTDAHRAFVTQSRRAATQRQRTTLTISSVIGLVAMVLAGFAYMQRNVAVENEIRAAQERDVALVTQSRFLADLARQRTMDDDTETARLLAVEALADAARGPNGKPLVVRPYVAEAERAINDSHQVLPEFAESALFSRFEGAISAVAISADDKYMLAAGEEGRLIVIDAQSNKIIAAIKAHDFGIIDARFSPDGLRIVTASADRTARVFNTQTGKLLQTLRGHLDSVTAADFSPDGKRIATASRDVTVRIWDAETGRELRRIERGLDVLKQPTPGKTSAFVSVRFDTDGKRILTGAEGGRVELWNATTGAPLLAVEPERKKTIEILPNSLNFVALSVDEKRVYAGFREDTHAWEIATGKHLYRLEGELDTSYRDRPVPTDGYIVTGGAKQQAKVWKVESGKKAGTLRGHNSNIIAVRTNHDRSLIATAEMDGPIRLWNGQNGRLVTEMPAHRNAAYHMTFSHNGETFFTGATDQTARIWTRATAKGNKPDTKKNDKPRYIEGSIVSPDGKRVVIFGGDAELWDPHEQRLVARITSKEGEFFAAAFSADSSQFAVKGGGVHVYEAVSGKLKGSFEGEGTEIAPASFSPDGKRIIASRYLNSGKKTGVMARVFDIATGKVLASLEGPEARGIVEFSPDGKRIIAVVNDGTARIFDAGTGAELTRIAHEGRAILQARFSPDQSVIVTASSGFSLRFLNAQSLQVIAEHEGAQDISERISFTRDGRLAVAMLSFGSPSVFRVASGERLADFTSRSVTEAAGIFSPDGKRLLAACSYDKTLCLRDIASGELIAVFSGKGEYFSGAGFLPDGNGVIAVGKDGELIVRKFPATAELSVARTKAQALRCLTLGERKEAFLTLDPPRWCITGPGLEDESNPDNWQPKWPYDSHDWREWLVARDAGEKTQRPDEKSKQLHHLMLGGSGALEQNRLPQALEFFQKARAIAGRPGGSRKQLRKALMELGRVHHALGEQAERDATWDAAVKLGEDVGGHHEISAKLSLRMMDPDSALVGYTTAIRFNKAATSHYAVMMNEVGRMLLGGQGYPRDTKRALSWFQKAAENGNAMAMFNTGNLHSHGVGVERDFKIARTWFEKAIRHGSADAMNGLGLLYLVGKDVSRDHDKARKLFESGAEKGNASAMFSLAMIHYKGLGVDRNTDEAGKWLRKSAAKGHVSALNTLSWTNLESGDFSKALVNSKQAIALAPDKLSLKLNKAHALMFLGRRDEAREIFLKHRGKPINGKKKTWEQLVASDFKKLRSTGREHPVMKLIEAIFRDPPKLATQPDADQAQASATKKAWCVEDLLERTGQAKKSLAQTPLHERLHDQLLGLEKKLTSQIVEDRHCEQSQADKIEGEVSRIENCLSKNVCNGL